MSWVNIASHLPAMAAQQPDMIAVRCPSGRGYASYTYAELEQRSNRVASGLAAIGIGRGVRTVLMVKPSLDFFALVFGLFKVGAVMVCIDPGMGTKNLGKCLAQAQPQAFLGIPKAQIARKMLGWARNSITQSVTVGGCVGQTLAKVQALGNDAPYLTQTQPQETAAILFTSGSTGIPKGVVYTHENFDAQVRALIDAFDIQRGEVDLCTFPLFALYAPAMGMSAVVPKMDFTKPGSVTPSNIINPIKQFNVTNMFGSPALLKRVGQWGQAQNITLPTLKRVISAGAPVPSRVIEQFSTMLNKNVQIWTPYGATESLPVSVMGSHQILQQTAALTDQGHGICIGKPVASIQVKIIAIDDNPITTLDEAQELSQESNAHNITSKTGEICVKGPQVTASYFNHPVPTSLAKINDADGSFWHRMGDLGYQDEQGLLWFCGRKSQRVITTDKTFHTIPCEAVFNTHDKVFRTALVAVDQRPVLCVELEPDHRKASSATRQKISQELLAIGQQFEHTRGIKDLLFCKAFPVDIRHNAKIGREQLSSWAKRRLR